VSDVPLHSVVPRSHRRLLAAALVAAAVPLSGCAEVGEGESAHYEPAKVTPIKGAGDFKRVEFTAEGARRIGLQTESISRSRARRVAPYGALIYDAKGGTYVYTATGPRTFVRRAVKVDRIEGGRVLLSAGPPVGTQVVTTGAAEVYGAELEIAASH
jgi:hypothetical protein